MPLIAPAILDNLGDRHHLYAVLLRKLLKVGDTGHRAILVHNLADDPSRLEACKARQVYRRLRLSGPLQNATRSRPKRENVARHHQVVRSRRIVDRNPAGMSTVRSRYTRRDAVFRLDGGGEGSAHPGVVMLHHVGDLEAVNDLAGHRQVYETTPV